MLTSPVALVLILVSSLCWSGLDLSRKVLVARMKPLPLLLLLTVAQIPLFAAWVWWTDAGLPEAGYWAPALGSVVLNVGANVAFMLAVMLSPLSVTIPLLSFVPVITTLLAIPMLGELPGPLEGLGILLVVVGALFLNLKRLGGATLRTLLHALVEETGSLLMLLVAVLWSLALPLDKLALRHGEVSFHALVTVVGVTLAVFLLVLGRREMGEVRHVTRAPGWFAVAVGVGTVALGTQLMALPLAWVSLIETIKRSVGNVMALVFGRAMLGEEITAPKVAAVLAMGVGVALVLL